MRDIISKLLEKLGVSQEPITFYADDYNEKKAAQQTQPEATSRPEIQNAIEVKKRRASARNPERTKFKIPKEVREAISEAAEYYEIPESLLLDIALQESSFNPAARNPQKGMTAGGLYQFTDPTWETVMNYGKMPNSTLNLPDTDKMNPRSSAMAAAYLIKNGQLGRWDASKDVWGKYYDDEELKPFYSQTLNRQ